MLNTVPNTGFYLQIPKESKEHILYPATVQEWNENRYTAIQRDCRRMTPPLKPDRKYSSITRLSASS